jgi:hypothetical protein
LRQVAADVVGPNHQLNRRLNANRVTSRPGGAAGAGVAGAGADRWKPQGERQERRQGR